MNKVNIAEYAVVSGGLGVNPPLAVHNLSVAGYSTIKLHHSTQMVRIYSEDPCMVSFNDTPGIAMVGGDSEYFAFAIRPDGFITVQENEL